MQQAKAKQNERISNCEQLPDCDETLAIDESIQIVAQGEDEDEFQSWIDKRKSTISEMPFKARKDLEYVQGTNLNDTTLHEIGDLDREISAFFQNKALNEVRPKSIQQ